MKNEHVKYIRSEIELTPSQLLELMQNYQRAYRSGIKELCNNATFTTKDSDNIENFKKEYVEAILMEYTKEQLAEMIIRCEFSKNPLLDDA